MILIIVLLKTEYSIHTQNIMLLPILISLGKNKHKVTKKRCLFNKNTAALLSTVIDNKDHLKAQKLLRLTTHTMTKRLEEVSNVTHPHPSVYFKDISKHDKGKIIDGDKYTVYHLIIIDGDTSQIQPLYNVNFKDDRISLNEDDAKHVIYGAQYKDTLKCFVFIDGVSCNIQFLKREGYDEILIFAVLHSSSHSPSLNVNHFLPYKAIYGNTHLTTFSRFEKID